MVYFRKLRQRDYPGPGIDRDREHCHRPGATHHLASDKRQCDCNAIAA